MKKKLLFLFAILVLLLAACGGGKDEPTPEPETVKGDTPAASSAGVSTLTDVKKAVVQIESQGTFLDPDIGLMLNDAGRGSGFLIDENGTIVTNNHVVTGSALVKVFLGGESYNAKILGTSECADLAVIKIDGGPFDYLSWYDGDVTTGLEVYSAGFPLGDPEFTLTKGIISKEHANGESNWSSLDYVLEHDATINPGNSGGPLITKDAQIVGVNYSSVKEASQYFAIDQGLGKPVIEKLIQGEDVYSLGINGTAVLADDGSISGIWVASVKSGSLADKAGLKPGDVLYQMENLVLATDGTMKDYCDILKTHELTDTLSVSVIRYATGEFLEGQINGRELEVTDIFDASAQANNEEVMTDSTEEQPPMDDPASGGSAPDYYVEEFDGDISNYTYFEWHEMIKDREPNPIYAPTTDNGVMTFELNETEKYVYVYYTPWIYEDTALALEAKNRGSNSFMTSLFCRYSDEGWYEVNIQNDGLYYIYAYIFADNRYYTIANGGSTAINQGKSTNQFAFVCDGETLTFLANGKEVKSIKDTRFQLQEGMVGFGVSSINAIPVKVEIESFGIHQP